MRTLILICTCLAIAACATIPQPTQIDTMKVCKSLCRSNVGQYVDDTVTCQCLAKEVKP